MLAKGGLDLNVRSLCQSAVSGLLLASFLREQYFDNPQHEDRLGVQGQFLPSLQRDAYEIQAKALDSKKNHLMLNQ